MYKPVSGVQVVGSVEKSQQQSKQGKEQRLGREQVLAFSSLVYPAMQAFLAG